MFELIDVESADPPGARLVVIGVGGGGGNAVNNMVAAGLQGVEAAVANTDVQALGRSSAPRRLQIGAQVTRGLGAGARPEVGQRAALEDEAAIREAVTGADMVFVTAGMGGGTGTGAAPVVARIARESGALTVGIVTKPFRFEGRQRARRAEAGVIELASAVDTLIVIPNDRLLELSSEETSFEDSFRLADSVLLDAVRSMTDIIQTPGLVNVDFADVVTVMRRSGLALMGTGRAAGEGRARNAAHLAISSPLLEGADLDRATGLLVNITGGRGMTLREIDEAMSLIQDAVHDDTETIFGAVVDPSLGDELRITVVATGFGNPAHRPDAERRSSTMPPEPPRGPSGHRHRGADGGRPVTPAGTPAIEPSLPSADAVPAFDFVSEFADEEIAVFAPVTRAPLAEATAQSSMAFSVGGAARAVARDVAAEAGVAEARPSLIIRSQAAEGRQATLELGSYDASNAPTRIEPARPTSAWRAEPTREPVRAEPTRIEAMDRPESSAMLDAPTFVRTAANREAPLKRQPVMRNPFSSQQYSDRGGFEDLDAPAFIRNR